MNDPGNEHSLGTGGVEGHQFFDSEHSEDDAMTADPEPPPPGWPTCETLDIGIRCIDVGKCLHDASMHRAIKAPNVPSRPPGQLYMHGLPTELDHGPTDPCPAS